MNRRASISFDKALSIEQSWAWWRHAWRQHFRDKASNMFLGALGSIGFSIAIFVSDPGFLPIFGPIAAIFAFLLLRPPFSYLLSHIQHAASLRKLQDDGHEIHIGFDAEGISFTTPERESYADWEDLYCYGLVGSLLVIYIDDPREPCFFAREEVDSAFFEDLLAFLRDHRGIHPCWEDA